ncbi:MAG: LacI family DNA-binding transcriptional regulator, partial [Oscillospiraceae bacterium]
MTKKNATIYDISKKLNVSVATVSRALNDNPRISQATKDL